MYYQGKHASSRLFGAGEGHPCPWRPYFSTWIPIWQDFPYNIAGQLIGLLYVWLRQAEARGFRLDKVMPSKLQNDNVLV